MATSIFYIPKQPKREGGIEWMQSRGESDVSRTITSSLLVCAAEGEASEIQKHCLVVNCTILKYSVDCSEDVDGPKMVQKCVQHMDCAVQWKDPPGRMSCSKHSGDSGQDRTHRTGKGAKYTLFL